MSRVYKLGVVVALIVATGIALSGRVFPVSGEAVAQPAGFARLPGTGAVVDAAKYLTLQEALDAIPAEGGVVRIPPGTFEIAEPLVIRRSDILIEGSGTATHIKNTNTSGKAAIVIESSAGAKAKAKDQIWRVQITNLRVTGNDKSGHGIHAMQVNEILLSGVTSSYHGGNGIVLDRCYEDPRVIGCLMTYNKKVGLNLPGCHDIVVSANQFEENQDALHCTDSFNLCMTGNCLDDHLGNGVVIENTYGSVLSGNMIEECNGIAVILDRDCYGITISSNVIAHNGGGVDLRDAHGCAVSANTFTINAIADLRIGPGSGRITVTGNNFSNSYLGEGKVKRGPKDLLAAGLKLEGTSDITITGNTFAGVRPRAIEADATSRRVLFSGNVITDAASDHEKPKDSVTGPVLNGAK